MGSPSRLLNPAPEVIQKRASCLERVRHYQPTEEEINLIFNGTRSVSRNAIVSGLLSAFPAFYWTKQRNFPLGWKLVASAFGFSAGAAVGGSVRISRLRRELEKVPNGAVSIVKDCGGGAHGNEAMVMLLRKIATSGQEYGLIAKRSGHGEHEEPVGFSTPTADGTPSRWDLIRSKASEETVPPAAREQSQQGALPDDGMGGESSSGFPDPSSRKAAEAVPSPSPGAWDRVRQRAQTQARTPPQVKDEDAPADRKPQRRNQYGDIIEE